MEAERPLTDGIPPPRACARCEYFDGGGERLVSSALRGEKVVQGDCLNSAAPRFQTGSHDTCPQFFPATGGRA